MDHFSSKTEQSVQEENIYSQALSSFFLFLELCKPRLTMLVSSTTFFGMLLAKPSHSAGETMIAWDYVFQVVAMVALVVAGAAVLNCYLEKETDALMERTKNRPFCTGEIGPWFGLWSGTLLVSLPLFALILLANWQTAALCGFAALLYLFGYTPMKKKSPFAVYVGAIPGAIPPVIGHVAVTGEFNLMSLYIFGLLYLWQLPHFFAISIIYAEDYLRAGVKVTVNESGPSQTLINIGVSSLVLAVFSFIPYLLYARPEYLLGWPVLNAPLLIGAFISLSLAHRLPKETIERQKYFSVALARSVFQGSLVYLPATLFLLLVFK